MSGEMTQNGQEYAATKVAGSVTDEAVFSEAATADEHQIEERIWYCKIGGDCPKPPKGADGPMREAVEETFRRLTGVDAEFTFSGWGSELTEGERAVTEDRLPVPGKTGHTFNVTTAEERANAIVDIPHFIHREGDSVTITAAADIEES